MRRIVFALALITLVAFAARPAAAQTSSLCNGYSECLVSWGYDTAGDVPGAEWNWDNALAVEWEESHTIGMWWWAQTEYGLMALTGDNSRPMFEVPGHLSASFSLAAGTYRLVGRHGGDGSVVVNVKYNNSLVPVNDASIWSQGNYTTDVHEFVLDRANSVIIDIEVNSLYDFGPHYFADLALVKVSNVYPTVPAGTPTLAPNATPVPVDPEYCQEAPNNNYANPTATPVPGTWPGSFGFVESFANDWDFTWMDLTASGSTSVDWINHTSTAPMGAYEIDWSTAITMPNRAGLAYPFAAALTNTVYLDGWAYVLANNVVAGTTVYAEVWKEDTGNWTKLVDVTLSAGRWQPFHAVLPPNVSAVAIVARRSDNSTAGSIVVDDFHLYDHLNRAKFCNGLYPGGSLTGNNEGQYGDETDTALVGWPANKPCPPDITAPSNFWGKLLAQITLFLDTTLAFMPAHSPGELADWVQRLVASPMVTFSALVAVFVDMRVMLAALTLMLALEGGRVIVSVWQFIKKMIPFLN